MLEAVMSVLGGGFTGLIGTGVQKFFDYKGKKLELEIADKRYAHEIEMKKADAMLMREEFAARTRVAEIEAGAKEATADAAAFAVALQNEPKRYSSEEKLTPAQNWLMVLLDFFRGAVRPGLTIYLCAITSGVYLHTRMLVGQNGVMLDAKQTGDLLTLIINTVLYLTSTCVMFWFGTRQKGQPPKK